MAKDYSQVNFRMPSKLKELLEKKAKDNERSLTAEIVARLEESLDINEKIPTEVIKLINMSNKNLDRATDLIEKLMARIEELETNKPAD
ncbi:Arc family DNA-binding protein [Acinetobacter baumannii]|uniref:Arc family DNA-binding protein n=1 Tax=Acinetobacter baumannii TaxID=470 RepID=UPI0023AB21AC|nr:Arc family DNA-binding protein [Acinetobacter baumannii]MDE5410511.1 Arc family DNA-binding protein [Acinetobacter baumannii]